MQDAECKYLKPNNENVRHIKRLFTLLLLLFFSSRKTARLSSSCNKTRSNCSVKSKWRIMCSKSAPAPSCWVGTTMSARLSAHVLSSAIMWRMYVCTFMHRYAPISLCCCPRSSRLGCQRLHNCELLLALVAAISARLKCKQTIARIHTQTHSRMQRTLK